MDNPIKRNESDRRFEAYKKAHEIREFEINLFWHRATYYWAFILAAFTAHFALLGLLFSDGKEFSIPKLFNLPGLSLFSLAVTAFFCYLFSLCWVLMNKGSKFWQKNWEEHINELEKEFSGNLYKVILDTENKESFKASPLRLKAYDYSVSKITSLTSIALMIVSFLILVFYSIILIIRLFRININFYGFELLRWIIGLIIILVIISLSFFICKKVRGNNQKNGIETNKWRKI